MRNRSNGLPRPILVWPFVGFIAQMVKDPFQYYNTLASYGKISWTSIIGKFMIHTWDIDVVRNVLKDNVNFQMFLHPNAIQILGSKNIAFMYGPRHQGLRKFLIPLFTRSALSTYLHIQNRLIVEAIDKWLEMGVSNESIRFLFRDLNIQTSTEVFVGAYMTDDIRAQFNENYLIMTNGFLALPINFPGTALWKAIRARKAIVKELTVMTGLSKKEMEHGTEPTCLLDYLTKALLEELAKEPIKETPLDIRDYEPDIEIAELMLDFLFASQDASTSSLIWSTAILADYPDVLAKIREEHSLIRPNGEEIDADILAKIPYTKQVVKEILRFRPPVTTVPQIAVNDVKLNSSYTIPAGSIIFPSIYHVHKMEQEGGFPNFDTFDPDRFSPERAEDVKHGKFLLTFGTGPHYCLGREYAVNHLICFVSHMATKIDIEHHHTPNEEDLIFTPTVIPNDGVIVSLKKRN